MFKIIQFQYKVCQTQNSHVTFVNGEWQGTVDYLNADSEAAFNSCPWTWDFLNQMGLDGWELVGVTVVANAGGHPTSNQFFLKKQI